MFAMSFAAKVAALRSFMGVPDDAPLPAAVEMMNLAMGIVGRHVVVAPCPPHVMGIFLAPLEQNPCPHS